LKLRALSLYSRRSVRQSTMRKPARAFGAVKFVFWIPAETSNAPLLSTRQVGNCDTRRIRKASALKLPKQLTEWLPVALIGGFLGAIGWFGSQIIHAAAEPFWKHIAPAIPQTILLSLCCLLLLTVSLLVVWVVYLHRVHREPTQAAVEKAFHEQFGDFVADRGVWTHKIKPGYFCPNCKVHLRESRMKELPDGRGWLCLVHECKQFLKNPDYKEPPRTCGARRPGGGWKV